MAEYIIWTDEELPEKDFKRIVRCRDCEFFEYAMAPYFGYCQRFKMRDPDGLVYDYLTIENGFCHFAEPKVVE